MNIVTETN